MSAILGIFRADGRSIGRNDLGRMVRSLTHRGPNGVGVWFDGPAGLGHQASWTTPEARHERFPIENTTRDLVLTADARIDNRRDLIRELRAPQPSGGEITDGELILRAYEKWGEDCPERLEGAFSFAIWDKRKRSVFCARDHLGEKPFYYCHTPQGFLFASEIKALLSVPQAPRRLNEERIADYLSVVFEDKAGTFYRDIFRLPPGHHITVASGQVRKRAYWSLDPSRELRLRSGEEYAEQFLALFTRAVESRLRSAGPVGVLLSGGLDSASVACVARHVMAGRSESDMPQGQTTIPTFSATFPDFPKIDERPFIEDIVKSGGFSPHFVRADHLNPFSDLDHTLRDQDEPFHVPNLYVYQALARAARREGVTVVLDGIDGDTTVSHGFEYLTELFWGRQWKTFATETARLSRRFRCSSLTLVWRYGLLPLGTSVWRGLRNGRRHALGGGNNGTINASFARRLGLEERYRAMLAHAALPARTLREDHWRNLSSGMLPFFLEVSDKSSAAIGIESRHPFFDRRLVEFCLALPPEQKLSDGWDRAIQRRALSHFLPPRIAGRVSKSNWSPSFERAMLEYGRETVEQVIVKDPGPIEDYVDVSTLRKTYERCKGGQVRKVDGLTIWTAVTLALWLRRCAALP